MIASATEKQKRATAQSKLRIHKYRYHIESIFAKDIVKVMERDAMELDAVFVNNMTTTLVGWCCYSTQSTMRRQAQETSLRNVICSLMNVGLRRRCDT